MDYDRHARETISFLPPASELDNWRQDYANMRTFFIYAKALDFDVLMERMQELQRRVNGKE